MPQLFYGQWVQQVSGTTQNLNDIFCVTEDLVFAVGDNGTILKTTDGGANWVQKSSGVTYKLGKVQFVNASVGYILGYNANNQTNSIIKTLDGGNTWINNSSFGTFNGGNMSCIDNDVYYYYGNYTLSKTINGGLSFQILQTNVFLYNMQFINEMLGFATGSNGFLKTIDGGLTWNVIKNDGYGPFYFLNDNIGFVGTSAGLFKTINGGSSFIDLQTNFTAFKFYNSSENTIWGMVQGCTVNVDPCYGLRGQILNKGSFQIEYDFPYKSISFANTTVGFALSNLSNLIYKNTTGTLSLNETANKIIFKISPNPTTNQIKILLDDMLLENLTATIIDSFGKNIFSKKYNFENNIIIDTQNFSKGIYFLTVTSGEIKQTEKLIIN